MNLTFDEILDETKDGATTTSEESRGRAVSVKVMARRIRSEVGSGPRSEMRSEIRAEIRAEIRSEGGLVRGIFSRGNESRWSELQEIRD